VCDETTKPLSPPPKQILSIHEYNITMCTLHYSTFATTSPARLLSTTVSLTNLGIQTA